MKCVIDMTVTADCKVQGGLRGAVKKAAFMQLNYGSAAGSGWISLWPALVPLRFAHE